MCGPIQVGAYVLTILMNWSILVSLLLLKIIRLSYIDNYNIDTYNSKQTTKQIYTLNIYSCCRWKVYGSIFIYHIEMWLD